MRYRCAVCGVRVNRSPRRIVGGGAVAEHFVRGARCAGSDIPAAKHARLCESLAESVDPRGAHPILVLNTGGRRPRRSAFTRRVLAALRAGKARAVGVLRSPAKAPL